MENKLIKAGENNVMANFVKTDDILKECVGLLSPHERLLIRR